MESVKNQHFMINHSTRRSVAGGIKTNSDKTLQVSLTDYKEIQHIENRKKRLVGRKPYTKIMDEKAQENHTYELTSGKPCTVQIELGSNTEQFRKQCDICFSTRFPRSPRPKGSLVPAIRRLSSAKDLESTRKLAGHIGHRHHLLQHGGRVTIDTGKITLQKHGKRSLYSCSRC